MNHFRTMRSRLVRIMLVISGLTGAATFGTVALISVQTSSRHLASVQTYIEEGIVGKGKVLTATHALALSGLVADNAFFDMQQLVERAVREDEELVYGLFVSSEGSTRALGQRSVSAQSEQTPDEQAWQKLGLTRDELSVQGEVVRRVRRLGEDLLEVAVPVTSSEGEKLGTLRYGLSTRRMHQALDRAQVERRQGLLTSVIWIASLVSLTTLVGLLLSRIQAFRITRPVGELTKAAHDLASGNRSVRVSIASGDELELLGSSFNHMVEELGTSYRALEEMNRTLEQKVQLRTQEVVRKNRDMRLVLDNVDQGFGILSPAGGLMGGHSRVVWDWFGQTEGDEVNFCGYIGQTSRAFARAFELAWTQLVEGFMPLALAVDQLPTELAAGGRTWSFRYLPLVDAAETLEGVLVVVAEITEQLARQREAAEQRELMQTFIKLMHDKTGFMSFMQEADVMVRAICERGLDADPIVLKRTLHTLKGNAGVMGLALMASSCHALEDQISASGATASASLLDLSERWGRINEHIGRLVPNTEQRVLELQVNEYAALIARLSEDQEQAELLEQVRAWALEPAVRPLERLAEQSKALAYRLGKPGLQITVQAGNVRLDPKIWNAFFAELVHVIRNAVDHGIETPGERAERGKPPNGNLLLGVQALNNVLTFEVTDDGRGIDWERIAVKAREHGMPHATPADLLAVLCEDGISTRSEVTENSGRGVGMAAFKECVQRLKGHIEVNSSGLGTSWLISFSMASTAAPRKQPDSTPVSEYRRSRGVPNSEPAAGTTSKSTPNHQ